MNQHNTRLIRLPEVLHRTGYGKAWIYHLINQNRFPSPVKIGARSVAFIESEAVSYTHLTLPTNSLV